MQWNIRSRFQQYRVRFCYLVIVVVLELGIYRVSYLAKELQYINQNYTYILTANPKKNKSGNFIKFGNLATKILPVFK